MDKIRNAIALKNRFLDAFESASRERVDPYLERVHFKLGEVVCEASGLLNHAYFPDVVDGSGQRVGDRNGEHRA
jgi:hypothetical protein